MKKHAQWLVLGLLATGCVEQPPARRAAGNSAQAQREVEEARRRVASSTAPTPQQTLNYNFGNKVTLLGYDITATEARPGSSFTITWYWRVDATVGDGWRLFTHLDDATNPRINKDGEGEVRRAYQPERWRRGEFITDRQTIEIPADWDAPVVKIHVGFWKDNDRLPLVSPPGHTHSDGRALALTLNTGVAPRAEAPTPAPAPAPAPSGAAAPAPTPHVANLSGARLAGALQIDGRLNEAAWQATEGTGALVDPGDGSTGGENTARGSVHVLWDSQYLYLGWEVLDDHLVVTEGGRDAHYWENDTTEVLLDPDGDGRAYYEIQVAPNGNTFDSQQAGPPSGGDFGNVGWNPELRLAVQRNGTLDNLTDTDTGYSVEMAIPWASVHDGLAHTPPQAGDTVRANFFLMDRRKQGGQRAAAWSPPRAGSFHVPERFGLITLRGDPGQAAPTAAASAPTARAPAAH